MDLTQSPPAKSARLSDVAGGGIDAPPSELPPLQPLRQHRPHCPWVAAWPEGEPSQPPPGAQPGWGMVLAAIAPAMPAVLGRSSGDVAASPARRPLGAARAVVGKLLLGDVRP